MLGAVSRPPTAQGDHVSIRKDGPTARTSGRVGDPATTPSDGRAVFELLEAKLEIPPPRPGEIPRVALVNKLRAGADTRIVSLSAPAGYGKTTLFAQWAAQDPRAFAWVTIDARDNDPIALLTHLAAALDRIEPVVPDVFEAIADSTGSIWTSAVPRLAAALASMTAPVVLVLDDVHELTERECLDALEVLEQHAPPGSQLALSGRTDSGLPLAKIRARGRLVEHGPREIAFTDHEARELLAALGAELSAPEAATMNRRAEGWPAGLYLAALVVLESEPRDAAPTFGGDDRFVADYLRAEHLSRFKPAEVAFLRRTSILERMSAALCDHLLERKDSGRRLEALERSNALLVPLDHHREWYRQHTLFREMLQAELEQREPELLPVLHLRASAWCDANGCPGAAIEHARAAGDLDEVARLFGQHALPIYRSGGAADLERWFAWFEEPGLLEQYPAVAGLGVVLHAFQGRADEAKHVAHVLETSTYDGTMPDGSSSIRSWAGVVRALLCEQGVAAMRADAATALTELTPASWLRPTAHVLHGVGALLSGDEDEAGRLLQETGELAAATGASFAGVVAHSQLALLALARGDRDAARAETERARGLVGVSPLAESMPSALLLAVQARVELERGRSASARTLLASAAGLQQRLTSAIPWLAIQTRLELAKAYLAVADVKGARELLQECADVIRLQPDQGILLDQVAELRAVLATSTGAAEGWASTLTAAELRLLPLLTTHLSFRELAERLFVSRNTLKTQAISIYRKLGASSRSEAIARAVELGLVDAPLMSDAEPFTRSG